MTIKQKIITTSLLTVLLATACSLTPDYQKPVVATPDHWSEETSSQEVTDIQKEWWTNFKSDELNAFMEQALNNNNNLQAGLYRIEQSQAALKIAGASLLPNASGTASTARSANNTTTSSTDYVSNWRAGAGISYALDLFGANRAGVMKAKTGLWGAQLDQDALELITMGNVAQQYFTVVNLRSRLAIADRNLNIAQDVLRIAQARFKAGSETALTVSQQKSALASNQASRASLAGQVSVAENAFAILLGELPGSFDVKSKTLAKLTIPSIAAGQPSTLLERRPDIRNAEVDLIGANADIGAARAAFFPAVNLGLDWNIAASGFGNPTATAASLASSLTAPIFQGGRLKAGVEQTTARQKELLENYQQTVLVAFQEVEDALSNLNTSKERESALERAKVEAQRSYNLTKKLYDAGNIDFQTLLDVQRTLLNAEDSFAQATLDRLSSSINLYLALGGGWQKS